MDEIDVEVRSILESLGRIMVLKRDMIHELPKMDALALALTGEMLGEMLKVDVESENYLIRLVRAGEDSFLEHKGFEGSLGWIDIMAANQPRMIEIVASGLVNKNE